MKRILGRATAGIVFSIGSLVFPVSAQPAAGGNLDPRLARRVELNQPESQQGETLKEALGRLAKSSGVSLEVEEPFDRRPLIALKCDVSLSELQKALARVYQLTWAASTGKPPLYMLKESRADRQARADVRAAQVQQAQRRMAARLEQVRRMTFMSRDELRRLPDAEPLMLRGLLHPRGMPMSRLLYGLPERMWQQLRNEGSAVAKVSSLSPELQDLAGQAVGKVAFENSTGEKYRLDEVVVTEGRIRLQLGGTLDRPTIWGSMRYRGQGMDHNLLYAEASMRQPPEDRRTQARANPSRRPDHPSFRRKVTLRDNPQRKRASEIGRRPEGAHPLAEYLRQLSRQAALPVVAECEYQTREKDKDGRWLRAQWWLGSDIVDTPLHEALDLLCADFEFEWRYANGMILLRPGRWYADPAERQYVLPKPKIEMPNDAG